MGWHTNRSPRIAPGRNGFALVSVLWISGFLAAFAIAVTMSVRKPGRLPFVVSIAATLRPGDPREWREVSAFLPASACVESL